MQIHASTCLSVYKSEMGVYMCVCVCVCVYVCLKVIPVYVHMYYTYTRACVCACVCARMRVCVIMQRAHVRACVCITTVLIKMCTSQKCMTCKKCVWAVHTICRFRRTRAHGYACMCIFVFAGI